MDLVPKLDTRSTKIKVGIVLDSYSRLKRIAGINYESKVTPTYSFEPRTVTNQLTSPIEKHVLRQVEAQRLVEEIERSINSISNAYIRQILFLRYSMSRYERDKDIAIYTDLGMSESEFYKLLEQGQLQFAETYKNGKLLTFESGADVISYLQSF